MSNVDFFAWSLLAAALGTVVGWLLKKAFAPLGEPLARWNRRRLQRRLDRRLARGSDRYFEELRSIEAAIAQHDAATARIDPHPTTRTVMIVISVLWAGALLTSWLAHPLLGATPPAWAGEPLRTSLFLLLGLQHIVNSFDAQLPNPLATRALGIAIFLLGIFMVADVAFRPRAVLP